MENCTYYFVEHDITDKEGWDGWMSSWFDICGESMIYDIMRPIDYHQLMLLISHTL